MGKRPASRRRAPILAILALGLALAAAPAAFQMFSRAPDGGRMIEDFRPYMSTAKIDEFRGYLDEIDAADSEVAQHLASSTDTTPRPALVALEREWPTINADMGDMLATMRSNIGRFRGISALPPFVLFPWFFVVPGVITAGLAVAAIVANGRGGPTIGYQRALVAMGLGVVMAPFIFQMFSRAPGGAAMIDEFRPLMTEQRVATVQGYFLTLGAAEGELRTQLLPSLAASDPSEATLPDARAFSARWPTISEDMAPMIGTMADNLGNFEAVDALPPFWAFPWFFVIPGLAIAALATPAARRRPPTSMSMSMSATTTPDLQVLEGNRS
ncbi:MAG: hypothetical protein WD691_02580 [Acidimicrobiales bacterium]